LEEGIKRMKDKGLTKSYCSTHCKVSVQCM
jgi:hypothetical protein